jgi:hypothetical protein
VSLIGPGWRVFVRGIATLNEETRLRHSRIKEVFYEASHLSGEAREEFLRSSCAGDTSLRREIESLLAYHDAAASASDPDLEQGSPASQGQARGGRGPTDPRRARSRPEKHS